MKIGIGNISTGIYVNGKYEILYQKYNSVESKMIQIEGPHCWASSYNYKYKIPENTKNVDVYFWDEKPSAITESGIGLDNKGRIIGVQSDLLGGNFLYTASRPEKSDYMYKIRKEIILGPDGSYLRLSMPTSIDFAYKKNVTHGFMWFVITI